MITLVSSQKSPRANISVPSVHRNVIKQTISPISLWIGWKKTLKNMWVPMQNFPYELIRQACKSYVCEKWLQFHMKQAQIKAFLKSHAKLYKTIYFSSYVLNFQFFCFSRDKSRIFFSRNRRCIKT